MSSFQQRPSWSRAVFLSLAVGMLHLAVAPAPSPPSFVEVTDELGLDFRHLPGDEGRYLTPEITGFGGGFLDYDNDGDLDVYLIQGGQLSQPRTLDPAPNRLFRQEGDGTLVDVTAGSGLGDSDYGMGLAVGDVDNDGDLDVYVSSYGADRLYRNNGDGSFSDVSVRAGIAGDAWSTSTVFCDYDRDGFLDLYVAHYLLFDPDKECIVNDGSRDYCGPRDFRGTSDVLYRNRGDGTFADVSRATGVGRITGAGLGVVCVDLDGDRWLDFYVANDGEANQLWWNQSGVAFEERALLDGVALNALGRPEAGMGVVAGDVDGDGDPELFLTHLTGETNTLYRNDGAMGFQDVSARLGTGAPSLKMTGFGTAFLDYDHDGDLDLALANGRVLRGAALPGVALGPPWSHYAEPNAILENDGRGRYRDLGKEAGSFSSQVEISRGLAAGDLDGDGDQDLLVTNTAGRARLFRNQVGDRGRWLRVRALGAGGVRDDHGAPVIVEAAGRKLTRLAMPGGGYLSSHDPHAHFGLSVDRAVERLVIRWTDGRTSVLARAPRDRTLIFSNRRTRRKR